MLCVLLKFSQKDTIFFKIKKWPRKGQMAKKRPNGQEKAKWPRKGQMAKSFYF
jgi:hypothetical protein